MNIKRYRENIVMGRLIPAAEHVASPMTERRQSVVGNGYWQDMVLVKKLMTSVLDLATPGALFNRSL